MEEDYVLGICDHCGEEKAVTFSPDPYIGEIFPEDENASSWWCDDCYDERRDNI